MRVLIPSQLRSYTRGAPEVEGRGRTLEELTRNLDAEYPGFRNRIIDEQDRVRRHIQIFVGGEEERDLSRALTGDEEVQIVGALTGG
jgi:sulfur-carrier protein